MSLEHFIPDDPSQKDKIDQHEKDQNQKLYQDSQHYLNEDQFQTSPAGKCGWGYVRTPHDGHFGYCPQDKTYHVLSDQWEMIDAKEALKNLPPQLIHSLQVFAGFQPEYNHNDRQSFEWLVACYRRGLLEGPFKMPSKSIPTSKTSDQASLGVVESEEKSPKGLKLLKKAKKKGLEKINKEGSRYEFLGDQANLIRTQGPDRSVLLEEGHFENISSPQLDRALQSLYQDGRFEGPIDQSTFDRIKKEVTRNQQLEQKVGSLNPESWQFQHRWYQNVPYAPSSQWAVRTAADNILLWHKDHGYRRLNPQTYLLDAISESQVNQLSQQEKHAQLLKTHFNPFYERAIQAGAGRWHGLSQYMQYMAREEEGVRTLYRARERGGAVVFQKSTEQNPGRWELVKNQYIDLPRESPTKTLASNTDQKKSREDRKRGRRRGRRGGKGA